MKWSVLAVLCLVRFAEPGALRCPPGGEDSTCTTDELEKELVQLADESSVEEAGAEDAECLPGSEWDSNCYRCRCSAIGRAVCSRLEECSLETPAKLRRHEDMASMNCEKDGCGLRKTGGCGAEPLRCAPNSTFPRGCDSCACLDSGLALCSLRTCSRSSVPKKSELVSGQDCAPGTSWRSQCNLCECTAGGLALCTKAACPGQETEPSRRCAPASMWSQACNTCWCTADGRAMCTKMGCTNEVPFEINTQKVDKVDHNTPILEPGATFENSDVVEEEHSKTEILDTESATEESDHSFEELDYNIIAPHNLEDLYTIEELENVLEEGENGGYKEEKHKLLKRSVCKPGQMFQSDCNMCKCSLDGLSYSCTQNECMDGEKNKEVEVFMESEGVDHIERHTVCAARGTFYIGCNTCHCNALGTDYSCTNKPCPLPDDVELFHELRASKSSKNASSRVVCMANRMFIKDCNTCWCNEDGTSFYCTRRVCVPELLEHGVEDQLEQDLRVIKKTCRPDEVFELDCNTCRCNPDGHSFSCTRRACEQPEDEKNLPLSRKTRGVAQEPPKTCQPGQEFRLDCNKCLCDNDGQDFSCTRNDCSTPNGNGAGPRAKRDAPTTTLDESCAAGSVFERGCSVCRCTDDGQHALCKLKTCVTQDKDDQANTVPEADPNFRCNPGEQLQRGCNDCSCSADGRSVFCTVRFCDQDVTPPPAR